MSEDEFDISRINLEREINHQMQSRRHQRCDTIEQLRDLSRNCPIVWSHLSCWSKGMITFENMLGQLAVKLAASNVELLNMAKVAVNNQTPGAMFIDKRDMSTKMIIKTKGDQ